MSYKVLEIVLAGSTLLAAAVFFLYRGSQWPLDMRAIEALGAVAILLTAALLFHYRVKRRNSRVTSAHVGLGLSIGFLWTLEIGMNNLAAPPLPERDIYDDLFWAAVAVLIFVLSLRSAARNQSVLSGVAAGFWSGFASGAVACLTALLFIVFGMSFLLRDPLNIDEWAGRGAASGVPDMAVYFAYQTLAGAIMHLIILGIVMGILLGIVGGLLGRASQLQYRRLQKQG